MAQEDLEALLTRIQAAARNGDAAARQAWNALIALLSRGFATGDHDHYLLVAPHRFVALIERYSSDDPQFARAVQEWVSQYGTVAASGEVRNEISGSNESISGPVIQGRDFHGNIGFGDAMAARPPGPPFGDDDWDNETDDDA